MPRITTPTSIHIFATLLWVAAAGADDGIRRGTETGGPPARAVYAP